jgi:hypothetical protein
MVIELPHLSASEPGGAWQASTCRRHHLTDGRGGVDEGAAQNDSGENRARCEALDAMKSASTKLANMKLASTEPAGSPRPKDEASVGSLSIPLTGDGQFADVAKSVLTRLDGHEMKVTKEQLAKALSDPSFTGHEAQVLAALYQSFDQLSAQGKSGWGFEAKALTFADVERYEQLQSLQKTRMQEAFLASAWSGLAIGKFAKDGRGLSLPDLDVALSNPSLSIDERQSLQYAKNHFNEIGHGTNLTKENFDSYAVSTIASTNDAKLVLNVWGVLSAVNEAQKSGVSRELYGPGGPRSSIKAKAVKQGVLGDCTFEADLAAVANAEPEVIRKSITSNPDGTYTVRFPGAKNESIIVTAPTEAELGLYDAKITDGVWPAVLKKAFGQHLDDHFWERLPNPFKGYTPQETVGRGGYIGSAMDLLTGRSHHNLTLLLHSQSSIADELSKAFSTEPKRAVSAQISGIFPGRTADGFETKHAYTVLDFASDSRGGGTVTVRNPHAHKDGTPDGEMQIPLSVFMKNFSAVAIED